MVRKLLVRGLVGLVSLYLILMVLVMLFEERFIFFPSKYPEGRWHLATQPSRVAIEEVAIPSGSETLHGWYVTPPSGGAVRPVLLWFHGNAGNLTDRYEPVVRLASAGLDVLIIDYQGYGKSTGTPSEGGLYQDAMAAWTYLTDERDVPPERIVIQGISLGGVPAIDLATKVAPAGLIVQSSFTSVADMAKYLAPFVPSFVLKASMRSVDKVPTITCPKLFVHSPTDEIVPYHLGKALYEAAAEPKELYVLDDAGHNETFVKGGQALVDELVTFVQEVTTKPPAP